MGETDNIARMASKVSDELFGVFGWRRTGPYNVNWACVTEAHGKATHPSDVVFSYEDPYRDLTIFWTIDLKSYAAGTINKGSVRTACTSLAKAVECASVCQDWQSKYVDVEGNWRCDGMLFVYNHDGEYTGDLGGHVQELDMNALGLSKGRRLVALGPAEISFLYNVTTDILKLRGSGKLPSSPAATQFYYPDLVRPKRRQQQTPAATIEMLTGPWITVHVPPEHNGGKRQFIVYYRGAGDTVDEFTYLIDSFFRFQMLDPSATIEIRLASPNKPTALPNFEAAKRKLSTALYGLAEARLAAVTCTPISTFVAHFDPTNIGMEAR